MNLEFHPRARDELIEAEEWYQVRSPLSAAAFRREVASAIKMIGENPEWYSPGAAGTRRLILPKFPFSVVYRIDAGGPAMDAPRILVLAVAHHNRRPGYWLKR
jgi:toxin ParE1/3/4